LQDISRKHPNFGLTLDGSAVWRWRHLYRIVVDLATSLGTATVIIFGVMGLAYRSLRIGLISIIPNMLPLAFTGACLVYAGMSLELVSVCAFTVCLGIAVDDTIHFLTRFQEEQARTTDHLPAIRRAFTAVGTGMIMTTLVLVTGFCTVLFSDSRDHRIFASMSVLTLSMALVADLFVLPALLACFAKKAEARQP
jgi:predicted RND superfamily exporter protein